MLNETLATLSRYGIAVERQVELHYGRYTDRKKIEAVNNFISRLPDDAWVVFADSDEFFSYPSNMHMLVQKYDHFVAEMVDRLSANGTIAPLLEAPDISVQFPIECGLRQHLSSDARKGSFYTRKVTLFRVQARSSRLRRHYRNPHNLNGTIGMHLGTYAHYTLTATAMAAVHRKLAAHASEAPQGATNASEPSLAPSIICSMWRHPLSTPCPDYKLIYGFMVAQDRNPWRPIKICKVPAPGSVTARLPWDAQLGKGSSARVL